MPDELAETMDVDLSMAMERATSIHSEQLPRKQKTAHGGRSSGERSHATALPHRLGTAHREPAVPDNLKGHLGTLTGLPLPPELVRQGRQKERKKMCWAMACSREDVWTMPRANE